MDIKQTVLPHPSRSYRKRLVAAVFLIFLLNFLLFYVFWRNTASNMAAQQRTVSSAMAKVNRMTASQGLATEYMNQHALTDSQLNTNSELGVWLKEIVGDMMQPEKTAPQLIKVVTPSSAMAVSTTYLAGNGIVMDGMHIANSLGSSIEGNEILAHTISLDRLDAGTCNSGQVLKFNGTDWTCGQDELAVLTSTAGAMNRLTLFSSTSGLGNSYLSQDANGLWIDGGKDLYVGGVTHGNGSGLYNLNGTQLVAGSVTSAALHDGSVTSDALYDNAVSTNKLAVNAVTDDKVAAGALSISKLSQSGCSSGQTVKWNGLSWACSTDIDTNTTYTAGDGVALNNRNFSINTAAINNWTGEQTFSGGLSVGSALYNNLSGSGLQNDNGILSASLGISIDGDELLDNAVSSSKLTDGAVTFSKLNQSGCTNSQTIKLSGNNWLCGSDNDTNYTAGNGLVLTSGSLSLDAGSLNSWTSLQSFDAGMSLGGNTYTSLLGSGLSLNGGVLQTTLGDTVSGNDIDDGAITDSKLAIGSISLSRLGQNSCTVNQTIKWHASGNWECAADNDQDTLYTAGNGISLASGAFSLDMAQANLWTAQQAFSGGIQINGNTYTDLAGNGLSYTNGALSTTLGTSIDTSEIADGAVSNVKIADGAIALNKLGQNGCGLDQVIKWNGSAWVCSDVNTTTGGTNSNMSYTAAPGLLLTGSAFGLDMSHANTWLGTQTLSGGLSLDGNTYTNLTGSGLSFSGGVLNTVLGTTIEASEISNGAITSAKLAPGVVTLDKLAQNGCSVNQIIRWSGSAWECIDNTDADTVYTATGGLALTASALSLDVGHANSWSATQSFDNGIGIGGTTYQNLAGTGLSVVNGSLQATLGVSVDGSEIADGAITASKIANGVIGTSALVDGSVTAAKLGQNGCTNGNVLKWQTSGWVCAGDIDTDTDTIYNVGTGLLLDGHNFSLDTASTQYWTAPQNFGGGVTVGGTTFTNLVGTGLAVNGGVLSTSLGSTIETAEITNGAITNAKLASGAITLDKLNSGGCTSQQTLKWSGSAWVCSTDIDTNTTYTAGSGLSLTSGAFSLDTTSATTWAANQSFAGGFTVGGVAFTSLVGTGLNYNNGALGSVLGVSIETNELADGAVSLAKLGQNGCSNTQILKLAANNWSCANDNDTTYSAGTGLSLATGVFSLDLTRSNSWSGLQTFSGGMSVGGNTYTNLAGSGLAFTSGTLSSTLGTSIETGEITDGAITSAKILDGSIISADLNDGAVTSAKILDGTISGADIASGAITANNIADGIITNAKLSASVRKRIVTANINIAASLLSTQEQPVFIAPSNGTISKVTFTSSNNIVAVSNGGTISVERKTATAGTVASLNLSSISMTALTPTAPTLSTGLNFSTGDLYTFKYAPGLVGLNLNNMLVTIEYTAND